MKSNPAIGELVKQMRARRSQEDLAAEARISLRSLGRVEAGAKVKLPTLRKLLRAGRPSRSLHSHILRAWVKHEFGTDFNAIVDHHPISKISKP